MIAIMRDGVIVSQSRNLRGIIRHSGVLRAQGRAWMVQSVTIAPTDSGARLTVIWADGSYAVTTFASPDICKRWCAMRRDWPCA